VTKTILGRDVNNAPLLSVENLELVIQRGSSAPTARPVRGVSFDIQRGQRLGLVGESGSGKSLTALTLMRLLPSAVRVSAGKVTLDGTDLLALSERDMCAVRGGRISMIYQDPISALNPVHTIGSQVEEAIRLHTGSNRKQARELMLQALADVGVSDPRRRADAYPHEFSGGMRQRVVIAMAMSTNPEVLVADEPTTALDVTTQARVMDLILRLSDERGTAVLLITHDLGVAAGFCDEIQVMYAGRLVERTVVDQLYERPLHPYSEALLAGACDLTLDPAKPIQAVPGQPPWPDDLPPACSFEPRCPHRIEKCREIAPVPEIVGGALVECHRAKERLANFQRPEGAAHGQ
jgi:peptide/nickel transport system ATP-binding protein